MKLSGRTHGHCPIMARSNRVLEGALQECIDDIRKLHVRKEFIGPKSQLGYDVTSCPKEAGSQDRYER